MIKSSVSLVLMFSIILPSLADESSQTCNLSSSFVVKAYQALVSRNPAQYESVLANRPEHCKPAEVWRAARDHAMSVGDVSTAVTAENVADQSEKSIFTRNPQRTIKAGCFLGGILGGILKLKAEKRI